MNIQHSRSLLDVRLVEKHDHLPPDSLSGVMLKTTRTIEDKNILNRIVTASMPHRGITRNNKNILNRIVTVSMPHRGITRNNKNILNRIVTASMPHRGITRNKNILNRIVTVSMPHRGITRKNVRGSITLKTYRQGYLYILPSRQNTICQ